MERLCVGTVVLFGGGFMYVVVVVVVVVAVVVVIFVVVVVIVVLVFKGGCDEANYWLTRSVYWLHLQLLPPKLR